MNKKILEVVLCLLFSFLGISPAFAFAGGSGTPSDPYQIATCADLQNMSSNLSASYVLINDVNCSETQNWNNGQGFVPVGNMSPAFSGSLNGNNHKVFNLYINMSGQSFGQGGIGLFGYSTGSIANIGLEDVEINGFNSNNPLGIGALVGANVGTGVIANSYSTGTVRGDSATGGLVGRNLATITNSYSNVNVIVQDDGESSASGGGLAGINYDGKIINSYATGNVEGAIPNNLIMALGGLAGINNMSGSITGSFATGTVNPRSSGACNIGGLVGLNSTTSTINNSYATGAVYSGGPGSSAGGLVGLNNPSLDNMISNSYATGCVAAGQMGPNMGGLIGQGLSLVANSYYDLNTSCQNDTGKGIGVTDAQMMQQGTFQGWDFSNTWQITQGYDYPRIKGQPLNFNIRFAPISSPEQIGMAFPVTILANDPGFNGTVYLNSMRGEISPTYVNLVNGSWTGNVTLYSPGQRDQLTLRWDDPTVNYNTQNVSNVFDVNNQSGQIPPDANLEGIVKDGDNPVSGASIQLYANKPSGADAPVYTAMTGADGSYVLNNMVSGKYYIQVSQQGYDIWSETVQLASARMVIQNIDLTPANSALLGGNRVPVLLVPGIMGSTVGDFLQTYPRLPPLIPTWDRGGGFEILDPAYKLGWHGKKILGVTYTRGLVLKLEEQGYKPGITLFEVPYDWSLSVPAVRDQYLRPWIEEAKRKSGMNQVDIIAHSMGGLVARSYIQSPSYNQDVRKLAMVGTPSEGADNVYYIWEGGDPITADGESGNTGILPPSYFYTNTLNYFSEDRTAMTACQFYVKVSFTPRACNTKQIYALLHNKATSAGQLMPIYSTALTNGGTPTPITQEENTLAKALNNQPCYNPKGCVAPNGSVYQFTPPANVLSPDSSKVQTALFVGTGKNTINTIPVSSPSGGMFYQDGVPQGSTQQNSIGDGTVLSTSVIFDPSLNLPVMTKSGEHGYLIKKFMVELTSFVSGTPLESITDDPDQPLPQLIITTKGEAEPTVTATDSNGNPLQLQTTVSYMFDNATVAVDNPPTGNYTVAINAPYNNDYELAIHYYNGLEEGQAVGSRFMDDAMPGQSESFTFSLNTATSAASDPVAYGRLLEPPEDPQMQNSNGQIKLSWIDPVGDANKDVDHYLIYAKPNGAAYFSLQGLVRGAKAYITRQSWDDAADYTYVVQAVVTSSGGGDTVYSDPTFFVSD